MVIEIGKDSDEKQSMLDIIFCEREKEELCELTKEEKELIQKIRETDNSGELNRQLQKINDEKLKNKIDTLIDFSLQDVADQMSLELEKYYKSGFKDGVKLMNECFREN